MLGGVDTAASRAEDSLRRWVVLSFEMRLVVDIRLFEAMQFAQQGFFAAVFLEG